MTHTRIFARMPGGTKDLQTIARAAAHRVLDQAMAGDPDAIERMNWALRVTGDLVGGGGAHAPTCPGAFGRGVGA